MKKIEIGLYLEVIAYPHYIEFTTVSHSVEIFLFGGVEVKCSKIRVLFFVVRGLVNMDNNQNLNNFCIEFQSNKGGGQGNILETSFIYALRDPNFFLEIKSALDD